MRKQSEKTKKILAHIEKHPLAKPSVLAKKFDVHVSRIYQLKKKVNEAFAKEFIDEDTVYELPEDPTPMPPPEHEAAVRADMAIEDAKKKAKKVFVPTNVDQVLDARAADYGKFKDGAALMQSLKRTLADHAQRHGKTFADDQWEALEMIIHKVGRIVNGNPDKVDHWTDIAGYAKLVADRLEGRSR